MTIQLNKRFSVNPWSFLVDNVLFLFAGKEPPDEGIYDFDLCRMKTGVISANVSKNSADQPIKAYWLPWASKKTVTADLTQDTPADYFFTSDLGGCRVMVSPLGSAGAVRVAHIAGDGKMPKVDPTGSMWRSAEAQIVAASLNQVGQSPSDVLQRSRSLSSTKPAFFPTGSVTSHGYEVEEESGATVVGRKVKDSWEFWYQVYDYPDGAVVVRKVDQLWP